MAQLFDIIKHTLYYIKYVGLLDQTLIIKIYILYVFSLDIFFL